MKPTYIITGIVLVFGLVALIGVSLAQGERQFNYNLSISCQPNQLILGCPCDEDIEMTYEKISNIYTRNNTDYIRYSGKAMVGECPYIHLPREIPVTDLRDPDNDIFSDFTLTLRNSYQENKIRIPTTRTGGGRINVTR